MRVDHRALKVRHGHRALGRILGETRFMQLKLTRARWAGLPSDVWAPKKLAELGGFLLRWAEFVARERAPDLHRTV